MMIWTMLHSRMTHDQLGFVPSFLSADDPRPARDQFNDNYRHGGGWHPIGGFELKERYVLAYPGDPPLRPLAFTVLRHETVFFYPHSLLVIVQPDRAFEVARLD